MTSKLANLFILGVQKAGTTALASFLSQHPQICVASNKEAHVFDDPEYLNSDAKFAFAESKYAKLFNDPEHRAAYYCDATPITLFHSVFLKECVQYNQSAKYLVILRNPIERAFSQYGMSQNKGIEKRSATLAFLRDIIRFRKMKQQTPNWPFESAPRELSYLHRGQYCRQLKLLFDLVDRERVLVLWQQDLIEQHQISLDRIFNFLKVNAVEIQPSKVFSGDTQVNRIDKIIATTIAKCFFWFSGESAAKLTKILHPPS